MNSNQTTPLAAGLDIAAQRRKALRDNAFLSILIAIIFILTFTPIGFINLVVIKATIIHIPVIIGSILLGPKRGAILGASFGAASLISNTLMPSLLSFAFSPFMPVYGTDHGSPMALIVCFVPRILVGIAPWYVCRLMDWKMKGKGSGSQTLSFTVGAVVGSMINTILVMGLIYILFHNAYAQLKGVSSNAVLGVILGVVGTNGIPEAIVAAVMTSAICLPMKKVMKRS